MQSLNNELAEVKEKIRLKNKWESHLKNVLDTIEIEEAKRQKLKQLLNQEKKDVDKLEGLSVASVFYTLIGQKLEKMDKEKQELLGAQLKYQEAMQLVQDLQNEKKDLEQKLATVSTIEQEYDHLLKRKEQLIHAKDPKISQKLDVLFNQAADLRKSLKEFGEAIEAGNKASASLKRALSSLENAKGWSTFDMLGGGMISTAIKHSHIDESRNEIHDAQQNLRHFQKELQDVNEGSSEYLNIGGLLTFADYFFDGIIADWFVHGHIQDSYEQTSKTLNEVSSLLSKLQNKYEDHNQKLSKIEQERISLILP